MILEGFLFMFGGVLFKGVAIIVAILVLAILAIIFE